MGSRALIGAIGLVLGLAVLAFAQNQHELNERANEEYNRADAELNEVYRKLRAGLSDEQKTELKEIQLLWIEYRDRNAAFEAARYEGGSMRPLIHANALTSVTKNRVEQLKGMFPEGYPE